MKLSILTDETYEDLTYILQKNDIILHQCEIMQTNSKFK